MDKTEARALLEREVASLRTLSYQELLTRLDEPETHEVVAGSGVRYQVETEVFWDGKPDKDLRVVVAVDDGGWSARFPMSDSFIRASDGSFVGE